MKRRKLKIGFFPLHTFSKPGGVKVHVLALHNEFRKRGIESKIIVPRRKPNERYGRDIKLLGTSFPFPYNGGAGDLTFSFTPGNISRLLEKEKFDILHFHNFGVHSWQVIEKSKSVNILTFHSCIDLRKSKIFKAFPFVKTIFKETINNNMNGIIGIAPFNLDFFKDFKGEKTVIPNGIDVKRFRPGLSKIKKYDNGKINLLFLGRIEERKGLIYLLYAYKILQKKFNNLRLIVVGDGSLRQESQSWVKENGLKDVVFEGKVTDQLIPFYYSTCDIFVAPATFGESFGIVLLEAMASGKPVVAFSNKGYKRVLKGKGKEFMSKPRDWKGLANKIEILIKDKRKREEMGKWGIEESQKYSWSKIADRVLNFYQKVLGSKKYD